ncbi:glutathione-disulfide reductase [Acidisoma cellulosilytica]|uniref:Glutathione-disulfide reductase n=1 Tax=Acidisoma cellulosilyticum TaxID=2802395 RepID=A0A963Z7D7_9PROT|nr:glutathione-disulfide reductase [Acidisoma cellulosilyticum]MCB8883227.1 glutathione-disulfide reductase [Acidisoma cellulosilyticum]
MTYDFDLFVIGGGSGGTRLSRISASHGARVGVAEERFWGGTCVNVGCVPKKLMVQAAEYGNWAEDALGFGWDITKGEHDWQAFIAAKDREIDRLQGIYATMLGKAGAKTFDAHVSFIDPHTLDVGGERVTAANIVIATGSTPHKADIPGADLAGITDDLFYLPTRPKRLVIVGGGYSAVEFAGIFAGLGSDVHLVYRQPLPLRGFDQDLREALAEAMAAGAIHLHPSVSPTHIRATGAEGQGRCVTLSDGTEIETDFVVLTTGRVPNLTGLNLAASGVALNEYGAVAVDNGSRTNVAHIYAIGDVTDRLNLTPVAIAEGHALADTLFGGNPREASLENVPTAVFSDPPLATVGLSEEDAAQLGAMDIYVSRFTPMRHTLTKRAGRKALLKLVVDQKTQKVLGAHMLGEDAAEIMQGLGIAVRMGATKQDFDRTIGIHPTAAEEFVTMRTRTRVAGAADRAE